MYIKIPLNDKGIEEYNSYSEKESENLKIINISGDDYFFLEDHKYLDFLNKHCDTLIDLFEEEEIPNNKLKEGLNITKLLYETTDDLRYKELLSKFIEIFNIAISHDTFIYIHCYGFEER